MTQLGQITALVHYPVKGLSGQNLPEVTLSPGQGFPFDRMFGFARAGSGFDPAAPAPMPKDRFLMLMRDERLAGLTSHFDPITQVLELKVQGNRVHHADLSTPQGRAETEGFFARMFDLPKMPRFVHAAPHRFTDVSVVSTDLMNAVSLINLDSIAELESKTGASIAPERFRGNIIFRGWPAFAELELEGREITIGSIRARVTLRTRRCAATEVNPATARRDLPIPRLLHQHYGHSDMGVYAELLTGGVIRPGDSMSFT